MFAGQQPGVYQGRPPDRADLTQSVQARGGAQAECSQVFSVHQSSGCYEARLEWKAQSVQAVRHQPAR